MTARLVIVRPEPLEPIRLMDPEPMPPPPSFWLWLLLVSPFWSVISLLFWGCL